MPRLRRVLDGYVEHYKAERPNQGIGKEQVPGMPPEGTGDVVVDERLRGLLNSYRRAVA